jgi:hypothetical protein
MGNDAPVIELNRTDEQPADGQQIDVDAAQQAIEGMLSPGLDF